MESIEINLYTHPTFKFYEKFFELKSVSNYLFFIDEWMELMMTDKQIDQKYCPSDLLFFHQLLVELYDVSFALNAEVSTSKDFIATHTSVDENRLNYETYCRSFETRYLTVEELMQPLLTLNFLHNNAQLANHKGLLLDWLSRSIEEGAADGLEDLIFPLYRNTKRLIEASWLMYARLLNASEKSDRGRKTDHFCDTCPNLLSDDDLINPYLQIYIFFTSSSLSSYRTQLKEWFKVAIADDPKIVRPQNFNYLHDRLIQLLEACYLITEYQIPNNIPHLSDTDIFNDWMTLQKEWNESLALKKQYEISLLNDDEQAKPILFLSKLLTLENIKEMRMCLREWSYSGLPENQIHLFIIRMGTFELYEKLIKMMECAFLLVAGNEEELLNNTDYENFSSK